MTRNELMVFEDIQSRIFKATSGASLKDLGKKRFAFSKMDIGAVEMLARLEGMK
ncbi:hypothetical protein [Methanosarcina mazei]|uniref:hypothetical protein n=1 Tax=Methanosarcina mazei TaxID=2209 RepID=UPI0012D49882|nr:hypothetical protein [Methanosarcina mazei]